MMWAKGSFIRMLRRGKFGRVSDHDGLRHTSRVEYLVP